MSTSIIIRVPSNYFKHC